MKNIMHGISVLDIARKISKCEDNSNDNYPKWKTEKGIFFKWKEYQ